MGIVLLVIGIILLIFSIISPLSIIVGGGAGLILMIVGVVLIIRKNKTKQDKIV